MIIPALQGLAVEITSVSRYPNNPRVGNIGLLRESVRKHGQFKPLLVQRSTGYILAGNQTYQAMEEEKEPEVAVAFLDVDDATAKRIVALDNRASDTSTYEDLLLAGLLKEIQAQDDDGLEGTGYTEEDLDALMESLAREAAGPDPEPDEEEDLDSSGPAPWAVVVAVRSETDQADLMGRLEREGYTCRAQGGS